ncbi:MAG TPA: methylmalonyl Co-A mutase-associated GTPase MeaB [Acidimicrobiales bacterium]|nr:methylmalonyl Co-A mutase-associated GTPase MeaB [Acidimicrobiales bacterium]
MPAARTSDPSTLFEAARSGDRVALARLLSLVERGGEPSRTVAGLAFKAPGDAYSVGITGAPGAGKSTLTDRLIAIGRERGIDRGDSGGDQEGDKVAVLAVDPSSPFSGGAILGDRVRMQSHALDDGVFIRSMATRGHMGGLSVAVPDAVRVLSAVGMPVVLVETVGVGQQEVEVAAATDTTIVVVNPGWGDAIQANKAGLLEIADLFVINKADRPGARETRRDLELMLDLTELGAWRPPIVETVASKGDGIEALWSAVGEHRAHQIEHGTLERMRQKRLELEFHQIVAARVGERIAALAAADRFADIMAAMVAGDIDPYQAADRLLAKVMRDRIDP